MSAEIPFCRQVNWRGQIVPTHLWCPDHGFQRVSPQFDAFSCSSYNRFCMRELHPRPYPEIKGLVYQQNLTGTALLLSSVLAGDTATVQSVFAEYDALARIEAVKVRQRRVG